MMLVQFSEHSFDYLHPAEDGHVRADLLPSGCIFKATPNGTLVQYLARVSNNVTIGLFMRTLNDLLCLLMVVVFIWRRQIC